MTLLSVNNIQKTYQKAHKKAVSDVSFNVDSGDIVALLGPNGAGKTTTLKMILNLVSPDEGTVVFDGKDVTHNNLFLLKNTGVLLEGSRNMYWALSPMENFVYWGGQRGLSKKEAEKRGETLLKQFGLLDKKYTSITRLSRGMQQVVGICCAMIAEPKLLILDEPTLGLDLNATQIMIKSLNMLSANGVGILVTTHQMEFAQEIANKILLINHGKLVFSNSIKDSLEKLNKQEIFEVHLTQELTSSEKEDILASCELTKKTDGVYRLGVKPQASLSQVLKLLSELPISSIQTVTRGLDEIFKYYTEKEK